MGRVKIGIIGCGKQAPKHVKGYRADGDVDVVVADIDDQRARALAEREGLTAVSVDDVFADADVTAVDICTPTRAHAPLIRRALEANKAFLCEKPLCDDLAEGEALARAVAERGAVGMVGFLYRFVPAFEACRRLLDGVPETGRSAPLGRVVAAFMRLGGRGSHELWKHRKETGGGAINEMMVHMMDLALWYFGDMVEVRVHRRDLLRPVRVIRGQEEAVDAEDYVLVSLRSASGVEIVVEADLVTPSFSQSLEVQGENGTLRASITGDASFAELIQAAGGLPAGRTSLDAESRDFFQGEIGEFLTAVRTGRAPQRCTVADSVALMKVMQQVHNSTLR